MRRRLYRFVTGSSGYALRRMSDFKPGLEGVVAVETEIAEPDREGGQLRYRGIDIEELVGQYPYENVWGLLVDNDLDSKMPEPEPYEPARAQRERAGRPPGGDCAPRRRMEPWQAERDLGRAGPRGPRAALVPDDGDRRPLGRRRRRTGARARRGRRAGRDRRREISAALARRGQSRPRQGNRHVLDLHCGARPQRVDLRRPGDRFHRSRLRCRALVGRRRPLGTSARRGSRVREADAGGSHRDGRPRALGPGERSRPAS